MSELKETRKLRLFNYMSRPKTVVKPYSDPWTSCLLQVVHTKPIAALTQFCDFSSCSLINIQSSIGQKVKENFQFMEKHLVKAIKNWLAKCWQIQGYASDSQCAWCESQEWSSLPHWAFNLGVKRKDYSADQVLKKAYTASSASGLLEAVTEKRRFTTICQCHIMTLTKQRAVTGFLGLIQAEQVWV